MPAMGEETRPSSVGAQSDHEPVVVSDLLASLNVPTAPDTQPDSPEAARARLRWLCLDMIGRLEAETDDTRFGGIDARIDEAAKLALFLRFPDPPIRWTRYERDGTSGIQPDVGDWGKREPWLWATLAHKPEYLYAFGFRVHDPAGGFPVDVNSSVLVECHDPNSPNTIDPWAAESKAEARATIVKILKRWVSAIDGMVEPRAAKHKNPRKRAKRTIRAERDPSTTEMIIQDKRASGDYDVFLCHNSKDKPAVKRIGQRLMERGLLPWLDEWELRPGEVWQRALQKQIKSIGAAAVFVGPKGPGPWQDMELMAFLNGFVKRKCRIIPVVLPGRKGKPRLPEFLTIFQCVDFRESAPDPFEQLAYGITGERRGGMLSREAGKHVNSRQSPTPPIASFPETGGHPARS